MYYENENYEVDFYQGWLLIEDISEGKVYAVGLKNERGQSIVVGQFKDAVAKFGLDKSCTTFKKLAATFKE